MRKSFALLCALIMTCLTGLVHASHLKGGSVTWKKTEASGFEVKAEVIINFDLSAAEGLVWPLDPDATEIPRVNGHPYYKPGNRVGSSVSLDWGDLSEGESLDTFEVVAVDQAAQIVTVKAVETSEVDLTHTYVWTSENQFDITASASARDEGEELVNRPNSEMLLHSRVTAAAGNTPPAFVPDPEQPNLVIVDKGTVGSPVVTFHVPEATDPDAGDTVKYSFIEHESEASDLVFDRDDTPWEKLARTGMSITDAGVISWDTSKIGQTIKTYSVQVVARDYASGSTVPKSSSTLEFQVWIDDTTQTGEPEIAVVPATPLVFARPGEQAEFRVVGYDHGENSRLKLIYDEEELPEGAVLLPTAGFAGEGHDNEGDHLSCFFAWKPTVDDLDDEYEMHFKFEDEDGFQSDEVTVTVKVVDDAVPTDPLVLTVSQASFVNVAQGTQITFTATGTCATSGVPLALQSENALPDGAAFSPALPVNGTSSVTSTFTWQTDSADFIPSTDPLKIKVTLADAFRREQSVIVSISLLNPPPVPVIALAAGTTVPIPATAWEELAVNFTATGGTAAHPELTFSAENAGAVEVLTMDSPATGRLMWRVVPGQIQNGMLRIRVTDTWGGSSVLQVPIDLDDPGAPDWWDSVNPSEQVLTGGAAVDFSMANHGQLKAIASRAFAKLTEEFSHIDETTEGLALKTYVNGFQTDSGNYEPLLQGELRHAASLFYDAIATATGKSGMGYPWGRDAGHDHDHSPATVGQVKMVFSFPQPLGGVIFNVPPNAVAITSPAPDTRFIQGEEIEIQASASDPDGNLDKVEFYENGVLFDTDTAAPFEVTWPQSTPGTYVLTAKAIDARGLSRTSSGVSLSIDPNAPTSVAIISPSAGTHFPAGQGVTIEVETNDPDNNVDRVEFYEGSTLIGTSSSPGPSPYHISAVWNQTTPGTYELWAKVIDADNQELSSETVELVRDVNPGPVVTVVKPQQNDKFPAYPTSGTIDIEVTATDEHGVAYAEFFAGPNAMSLTSLGTSGAPYKKTWSGVSAGSYVVQVKVVDIYGASTTVQKDITVVTPTTVVLQEGVSGYVGMVDTYIRSNAVTATAGSDTTVRIDEGHPASTGLLRWHLATNQTGIPATAKVLDASITVNVISAGASEVYVTALKRDWDEGAATWNVTGWGFNWGTPGAKSVISDAEGYSMAWLPPGGATPGSKVIPFDINGRNKLESWIAGTSVNYGMKIEAFHNQDLAAIVVSSSEATTTSQRPKLTIVYY